MKKIQICKDVMVSAKIFTKTWQDLEKFFGVPIGKFHTVSEKKSQSIEDQSEIIYIIVSQDNDISKEDLIKKIDHDEDPKVNIISVFLKVMDLFPKPENLQEGGNKGNLKK